MIEIKKISPIETYAIRQEVLRKGIPLPYKFQGDFDKDTFHLGAFVNDKLVSVSSYMRVKNLEFNGEQYQLRGMATLEAYQGMGIGKRMMDFVVDILKDQKIDYLWCNARIVALKFYDKQDFKIFGDPFEITYIGTHYKMCRKILSNE